MSPPAATRVALDPDLVERVRGWLAQRPGSLSPHRVAEALRSTGWPVGDTTVLAMYETLRRDIVGAGPLDPLLALPGVTDILVNGPDQVWVDTGTGLMRSGVSFPDDAAVRRLAQRMAASAGRRLDDSCPWVDLRLADGTRFHAVLAPVSHPGTAISLRVMAPIALNLDDLAERGCFGPETAEVLTRIIDRRLPFLVSGGTGAGKTTLLSALLAQVPASERIVIVEDAAELRPDHPHLVCLEGRPPNVEGTGRIKVSELVRQALRMRPDRLVVGEVRGAEIRDLLAALNTGHEGGCGTIHANSATDVPARIEALALAAGLDRAAAHSQMAAGIGAVMHLGRTRSGSRVVAQIAVPERTGDGLVRMTSALQIAPDGSLTMARGPGWPTLREMLW